jgi:hypothetical protein
MTICGSCPYVACRSADLGLACAFNFVQVPQLLWGVASRPAQPRAMALRLATAALATGLGGGSSSSNSTGTSTSSSNRGTAGGVSAAAPPAFTPSANPGPREAAAVAALLPPAKGDQEVLLEYALKVNSEQEGLEGLWSMHSSAVTCVTRVCTCPPRWASHHTNPCC